MADQACVGRDHEKFASPWDQVSQQAEKNNLIFQRIALFESIKSGEISTPTTLQPNLFAINIESVCGYKSTGVKNRYSNIFSHEVKNIASFDWIILSNTAWVFHLLNENKFDYLYLLYSISKYT